MTENDKLGKVLEWFKKAADEEAISHSYAEEIESVISLLEKFDWDVDKTLTYCRGGKNLVTEMGREP